MVRDELMGRARELRVLDGLLAEALTGDARFAVCAGEPGIGKSRLVEELAARGHAAGAAVVWGRAVDLDGTPPYWLFRQILRDIGENVGAAQAAADLGVLTDLAVIEHGVGKTGFGARLHDRFRVFDAVTRVLDAAAADRGLVVVVEDIHWADQSSLALLRHVVHHLTRARLLIAATARGPEVTNGGELSHLISRPATQLLELTGLSCPDVHRQLIGLTAGPVATSLARRIHDLSGGNPFFVRELARDIERVGAPVSVRAMIARRLAALSPSGQAILAAASVVGQDFSAELLAATVGEPVSVCLAALREAEAAGLAQATAQHEGFRFVHALTREVVEAGLPVERSARLHLAAAKALEELDGWSVGNRVAELARHWAAAAGLGDRTTAVEWVQRAADDAMSRLAFEEAARLYELSLTTGAHDIDDQRRGHLLLSLARALRDIGPPDRVRDASDRAAAVARQIGRFDLAAEAVLVLDCQTQLAWDRSVRERCADALAALGPQPTALQARLLSRLAEAEVHVADLSAAVATSRQAVAVAEDCADPDALVAALRAQYLVCAGGDEGLTERQQLADRLSSLGSDRSAARLVAHAWRVDIGFARGDLPAVAAELERFAWCVAEVGGPIGTWQLLRYQAALAQARGDFREAVELADAAFRAIEPVGHPAAVPVRLQLWGMVEHHVGAEEHSVSAAAVREARPGGVVTPGHAFPAMDYLGPALLCANVGHSQQAAAKLTALGLPSTWQLPHYYRLPLLALGVLVGVAVGARPAVADLHGLLRAHRGQHVVSSTEVTHYLGPVDLYYGKAARFVGDLDDAVDALGAAVDTARTVGAAGFHAEATYELAAALASRGRSDDLTRARTLSRQATVAAKRLGMRPMLSALEKLAAKLPDDQNGHALTARETDVALLVARGLTNRQIAAALTISERTAQNHVQHILSKLSYARRSQIAVWAAQRIATETFPPDSSST